jgi:hypothetical protein
VRLVKSSLVVTVLVGASLVSPGSLAQADHLPAARDLTVRLTPDGVQTRDSLRAGRYRIEVRTPRKAFGMLTLLKPARGFTRADLRQGHGNVEQNLRLFGGLTLYPGQTGVMWETLYAGRYWLVSQTFGRRSGRERIRTIRVHGTPSPSRFPRVSAEATNRDNGARITARIPRAGRMLIRNTSPRLDGVVLLPLKDGFTYHEFLTWLRRDGDGKVPIRIGGFRLTGYTSPGVGYVLRYRLRPGNWVVTDPRTLFGVGRQHDRLTQAFRPLRVRGGKPRAAAAVGAARYEADGFTGSPRQRRTVGRALERIAEGQTLPGPRTSWQPLKP